MRCDDLGVETHGVWTGRDIVLHRPVLGSLEKFASVLLHEAAHAESDASDSTRLFEDKLTTFLGRLGAHLLDR